MWCRRKRGFCEHKWLKRTVGCGAAALLLAAMPLPHQAVADGDFVPPGVVKTMLPSDDEVAMYYGMPMTPTGPVATRPGEPWHLVARDDCLAFLDVVSTRAWGDDYASFRGRVWNNTGQEAHAEVAVGTYATSADAHTMFGRSFNQAVIDRCRDAHLVHPDSEPGVTLDLVYIDFDPDAICAWLLTQRTYGRNVGYTIAGMALVAENFMMTVFSGQWGNAGDTMNRLFDHVLDRAP